MKVKDIMTREVESCSADATLTMVARRMWEAGCGAIPLVDARGRVAGIITDRDISMTLVSTARKPTNIAAWEAMSRHLYSCGPDDDVKTALEMMKKHHVRRLPVLSNAGRLEGILSIDDIILRALAADAPTSGDIIVALREILEYRNRKREPEVVV